MTSCAASSAVCSVSSARWSSGACVATCAGTGAGIRKPSATLYSYRSSRARERALEELAAMAQAFLIDAVADAFREMPLHRDAERGKPARGLEHRLRRN